MTDDTSSNPRDEAAQARDQAEAAKYRAEARRAEADAIRAEIDTRKAELELAETQRQADIKSASNSRNHVFHYEEPVRNTKAFRETLDIWHRLDASADWFIVMNSPGGSVIDGMALFDHITAYSLRGGGSHKVTIICRGYCASMAGILMQAADERVAGPESYLMLHKVSTMTGGSLDDIEDEVAFLKMITARVEDVFVNRSGGKLSKATLRRRWSRKDWWTDSKEALKFGLIDRIG